MRTPGRGAVAGLLLAALVVCSGTAAAAPASHATSGADSPVAAPESTDARGDVRTRAAPPVPSGPSAAGNGTVARRPLGPAREAAATAGPTIDLEQRFDRTPERPGEVVVRLRFRLPDAVTTLRTNVPVGATVTGADGFAPGEEPTAYVWDGETARPTLTYRYGPNETFEAEGPIAGRGDAIFTDAGPWALIRLPGAPTAWNYRTSGGAVGLNLTRAAVAEAAFGETMAYLGPHREYTREGAGQRFRLVVPARARLAAPREEIFDSLVDAAGRLRVGDRDEAVVGFVAPTDTVRWGVRGLQTGDADFWVRDVEPVDAPGNVWVHEYVHTRQAYRAAPSARWVTEATASYYAALLSLRQGRTDFEAFSGRLALGEGVDAVLADPTTWGTVAPYTRGALVAGELDRRIRLATGGNRTLQDVLRRLNEQGDVDGAAVIAAVRAAADRNVANRADRLSGTNEPIQVWDRAAQRDAFSRQGTRAAASPSPETTAKTTAGTATGSATATASANGPGFGAMAAVVALLLLVGARARRRGR